jgi:hypothetical protein
MPHLQPDFFQDPIERKLFECMKSYFDRTKGKMATKEAVEIIFGDANNRLTAR